jgi:alkaline phosphatase D
MRRRTFLANAAAGIAGIVASRASPLIALAADRPLAPFGVQSGDPDLQGATIWGASDRPARMMVEVSELPDFRHTRRLRGPDLLPDTAFTGKLRVPLPPGESHVRVVLESLLDRSTGDSTVGRVVVPSAEARDLKILWSGDTAGQGWGISPEHGGMRTYRTMLGHAPDLFIHCGDVVYADGPLEETVALPDGGTWRNIVTPEKTKVAETLDEFRGQYRYNLLDEHVRAFHARTPWIALWDDHETVNNWYPGEVLDDPRYTERSVDLLAARARRAFHEWTPTRIDEHDPSRIFRRHPLGPLAEVFALDLRSYRRPNGPNDAASSGSGGQLLGREQFSMLVRPVAESRATWKIIASDLPIGLIIRDGPETFEGIANRPGPPRGREIDIAGLLSRWKALGTRNIVWVTADVHYTAAHHYHPDRARFRNFLPFREYVSGPLHAGTFGPNELDDTFGPEVVFAAAPPPGRANLPPSEGMQFFGELSLSAADRSLTVRVRDVADRVLHEERLEPE